MQQPHKKKGYWRSRGWKDLIFVAVVAMLGYLFRHDFFPLSDHRKWEARPRLEVQRNISSAPTFGSDGVGPCFFTVPDEAEGQPIHSGTVSECLELVPDGRKLNLFEAPLGGRFMHVKTDLWIDDVMPLAFTRITAAPTDWDKRSQNEIRNVYNLFLFGDRFPYAYTEWILPDDQSVRYDRISRGTGFADAVYEHWNAMPVFGGSRMAWNGSGWDLSLQSGITYLSPEAYYAKRPQQGSLAAIFDAEGHEVRLLRKSNGDLRMIRSPAGRWLRFAYDGKGRISAVWDDTGHRVQYTYDSEDRLSEVRYSTGEVMRYVYDSSNRIVAIQDSSEKLELTNAYDPGGRLTEQALNGQTFRFHYTANVAERSGTVRISGPQEDSTGVKIVVAKGRFYYTVGKIKSASGQR